MACSGDHRPARSTRRGIQACRRVRVRNARCGGVHWGDPLRKHEERDGGHPDRPGEKACKTTGCRTAWSYCRDVEIHREMLVRGPYQEADHERGGQDVGRICQQVFCPPPALFVGRRITSRPTLASKARGHRFSSWDSPPNTVRHLVLGPLTAVLSWETEPPPHKTWFCRLSKLPDATSDWL